MAATAVTLNEFQGHLEAAGLFKCNPTNICAAFYTISADTVLARSLCVSWACCFQSIPSSSLNGSLRNFNTWPVLVSNRILPRDFYGPKTTYFRRLRNSMATLRANFSGEEHDIDNRETALETTNGLLHCLKISWTLVHLRLKVGAEFLPTLRKFCVFLHCRDSHTHFRQQNSTKLCHIVGDKTR